jgi:hypothetical protein
VPNRPPPKLLLHTCQATILLNKCALIEDAKYSTCANYHIKKYTSLALIPKQKYTQSKLSKCKSIINNRTRRPQALHMPLNTLLAR